MIASGCGSSGRSMIFRCGAALRETPARNIVDRRVDATLALRPTCDGKRSCVLGLGWMLSATHRSTPQRPAREPCTIDPGKGG